MLIRVASSERVVLNSIDQSGSNERMVLDSVDKSSIK